MPLVRPLAPAVLFAAALGVGLTACVPAEDGTADVVEQPASGTGQLQEAAVYVGMTEENALARAATDGVDARVGTAADIGTPAEGNYELGRLTFVVVDGVVAEVIVETEDGPVPVAAS